MIALGVSQYLYGQATVANTVYITMYGLVMSSASPPVATGYQQLYQGTLSSTFGTLYGPGGSATALISHISLFNTTGTASTVQITTASSINYTIAQLLIPPNGWATYEDGNGWTVFTANGNVVIPTGISPSPAYPGIVANTLGTTMPRGLAGTATEAALTGGQMTLYPVQLQSGVSVGHLAFVSGTTGASTPTHWWFCLCNSSLGLLAITADQTTTAWAASTVKSLAIANISGGASSTFTTTYTGTHYIGIMMTGTTVPTLYGWTPAATAVLTQAAAGVIGGKSSTTGLTTPSGFPTTYGAITNSAFEVYGEVAA